MLNKDNLYKYQKRAVNTVCMQKKIALFLDMGLGKTAISLYSIWWLKKQGMIRRTLIISPKSVCEVWKQEVVKWQELKDLSISIVAGDANARLKALNTDSDIYCIGRDNVRWMAALKDKDNGYLKECNMLVVDESTSFKHRSSLRWKSLCQKGKRKEVLLNQFDRVVLLTGTPASESYEGLWAQIYLLDKGERLSKCITNFRVRYMIPDLIKNRVIYRKFREGAIREIDEKIKDICVSMKSEDYLELPDKIDIIRYTGYKPDALYKAMRYDGVINVDGTSIMAVDPATRYGKLRQIATGAIYDEDGSVHVIHKHKVETLKDVLEEIGNENVLVFYQYEFEKDLLITEFNGRMIDTAEAQDDWNKGKIKVAIANPVSIGYGVNIQYGGSIMIFYSLPLSYENYIQSVKRLHRQGQADNKVKVIHLISEGTVEEKIYELLKTNKANLLQQLMEYHKIT